MKSDSLVIEKSGEESVLASLIERDVDYILSRINGKNGHRLGFLSTSNHNGKKPGYGDTIKIV